VCEVVCCKTVDEASRALAQQYTDNQRRYIEQQLNNINSADESGKPTEIWKVINNLPGRKSKSAAKVKAENPKDRTSRWRQHFEKLLNNDTNQMDSFVAQQISETLEDVPTGEFSFEEISITARELKSGHASGADSIPPDILRDHAILNMLLPIPNSTYLTCEPMFPLSCAAARPRTCRETAAQQFPTAAQ